MSAIDLLQRVWTATLAVSAALLIVAALRLPWRRAFGIEHACRLWWLPLLALIASQLPHAAMQTVIVRVPVMLSAAAPIYTAPVAVNASVDWPVVIAIAWAAGIVLVLLFAAWRQARFLRGMRDAQQMELDAPGGIAEILRARDAATGPALVGAWRPRLVLPCDFEQRYDAHERALILAHEAMHARRRDGLIGAVATLLHALFWFHPLAWWALPRLRRDQELACDAAVLRERPRARRSYANAMLKAQFAGAVLPAGSFWPGHPIRERILMLKSPSPDSTRRIAGRVAVSSLAVVISAVAYAAGQPPPLQVPADGAPGTHVVALAARAPHAPEYQLALQLKRNGQLLPRAPIVCMHPGGSASISEMESENGDAWGFDLKLRMEMADRDQAQVTVDGSVRMDGTSTPLHSGLRGPLGQPMSVRAGGGHDTSSVELAIVPTRGCTARLAPPPPPPPPPPAPPPPPVAPPPPAPSVVPPPPAPSVVPPLPPPAPTVEPSPPHAVASQGLKTAAVPSVPARPAIPAPSVMPAQSAVLAASPVPVATPAPTVNPASAAQVPAPASSEQR